MENSNKLTNSAQQHPKPSEDVQLEIETVTPATETAKQEKKASEKEGTDDQKETADINEKEKLTKDEKTAVNKSDGHAEEPSDQIETVSPKQ